jgi:hypothetical protein
MSVCRATKTAVTSKTLNKQSKTDILALKMSNKNKTSVAMKKGFELKSYKRITRMKTFIFLFKINNKFPVTNDQITET